MFVVLGTCVGNMQANGSDIALCCVHVSCVKGSRLELTAVRHVLSLSSLLVGSGQKILKCPGCGTELSPADVSVHYWVLTDSDKAL